MSASNDTWQPRVDAVRPQAETNDLQPMAEQPRAEPARPPDPGWLKIESLDLDAQGVAHTAEGKVVFVEDALPGEEVQVKVHRRKSQWEQAGVTAMRHESAQRVVPKCPHFGLCGGCKMQHLHIGAQVATKQRALEDALWHLGKVRPEQVLRPIEGPAWGYRHRARMSVKHVVKKGSVLIGFHERKSSFIADMDSCEVLPPHLSRMLLPLRALIASMDQRDRLPQIEIAVGDAVTALVLRHLEPLSEADLDRLRKFGAEHDVQWWLQAKGPDTVRLLEGGAPSAPLSYALPEFGVVMPFTADRFHAGQSAHQHRVLVARALRLLGVEAGDRVIDWFCGLGNFTLPLATRAREVLGIEGSAALVRRAEANAVSNGLAARARFATQNLFEITPRGAGRRRPCRALADRPRRARVRTRWSRHSWALVEGQGVAGEPALVLASASGSAPPARSPVPASDYQPPNRIVYVSCQPCHVGSRCRFTRPSGRLPLLGCRQRQHVPAHRPRREHCRVRPVARCRSTSRRESQKERVPKDPVVTSADRRQLRLPPKIPRIANNDWKMLYRSR